MKRFFQKKAKSVRKRWVKLKAFFLAQRLKSLHCRSCRAAIDPSVGAIVSLTSYGPRIKNVYLTLESIAQGVIRPRRLILWLDEERVLNNLPKELIRLQARGVEIRGCENLGPHKKYYPLIEEGGMSLPLVTADDDVLYPKGWLEGLTDEHRRTPNQVICYRAHRIGLRGEKIAPYGTWNSYGTREASFLNFATGVSGVLYPPAFLERLRLAGRGFLSSCPMADDIWLHVNAIRNGFKIREIGDGKLFPEIPGSQKVSLHRVNVGNKRNDEQIDKTYSPKDIRILVQALQGLPG